MNRFLYGSVYKVTREDTPETVEQDFRRMKSSGFNTVVIWPPVFYWEEKGPDYPFRTGKTILRLAESCGLRVIMELAGQLSVFEYIPDFEMKEEYYAQDENGHREWGQDSFGFLNYFHPEVKGKICAQFRQIAQAYRDFPALYAYDVFNETMFRSFDPYTMEAFRTWLRKKYGSIERLNRIWERDYTSFSQVRYEKHKWMSIMPKADWCAFRKAAVGIFLQDWCDAVREADPKHPLIADNIHSQSSLRGSYTRPQDDYGLKDCVDEIGMSFYPKTVSGTFAPAERHQIFSGFADAARGEGFFLSEMQTHIQAMFNPTTAVRPSELRQWCFEAYAHGAKALIYWMWRPFTRGLQTLGRGLVDYRGRETERLSAAKEIGEVFRRLGPVRPVRGKVGIVYDPLCEDFQYLYTESYKVEQKICLRSVTGAYRAMFDLGISCDLIRWEEIASYPVILLSNQIVLTREQADALRRYLTSGGVCIADGRFGLVDETAMLYRTLPGGSAYDLCGQDLLDSDDGPLDFSDGEHTVRGFFGRDRTELTDGTALCRFADGAPAVTERKSGAGRMISLNTCLCYGYEQTGDASRRAFLERLLKTAGILPESSAPDVKFVRVRSETGTHLIAFNYADRAQTAVYCADGIRKEVTLAPDDAAVFTLEEANG